MLLGEWGIGNCETANVIPSAPRDVACRSEGLAARPGEQISRCTRMAGDRSTAAYAPSTIRKPPIQWEPLGAVEPLARPDSASIPTQQRGHLAADERRCIALAMNG